MSEEGRNQLQTFGAGLLGFLAVVSLGGMLILHQGGTAVKAPVTNYAPVDAASSLPTPAQISAAKTVRTGAAAGASAVGAVASSPAPLLPADEDAPAAGFGAPKLVVTQHLGSGSASSSASTGPAPSAQAAKSSAAKKKAFAAPKLDLTKNQGTIASSVHYGVSSRAELMGRAAGPVYNFAGKGVGAGAPAAGDRVSSGEVVQQIDATQRQVDDSSMAPGQKAQVGENLNQARQTVQSAGQ